jgi:hypothetical protein
MNAFTNFLALQEVIEDTQLFEKRLENDASGRALYVGISITPSAATDQAIWYIIKLEYDVNNFLSHVQLPNPGVSFTQVWDNRSTYF